jgi:cytochrome P450
LGNRLAEMQLAMVWQEIMKRFHTVEVGNLFLSMPTLLKDLVNYRYAITQWYR